MGTATNLLLVSVIISALDRASPVLRLLGLNSISSMGLITMGAAAVVGALAGIGVASVGAAVQFDQAMHKVYALTGISGAQMDWYKNKILQMAPAIDQAPTALANGLYYVISAGFQGQQALDILSYSAKAAAAGMTKMDQVADVVTSAMRSFAEQGLSAGHATDDIMKAVTYGKIQLQQLATGLSFAGVQAGAAGFSFDETAAAVSALSQMAGNRGARRVMMDLGNLFRQLGMRDITTALKGVKGLTGTFDLASYAGMSFIDKVKYIAKETGLSAVSLAQLRQQAHGNVQVFEQLALAHMKSSASFLKLIGGAAAALPAFMLLEDNGKEYNAILAQMGGNGEFTAQAFDKMRQSAGQKWNMVKVALTSILTLIGEQLLPVVSKILDVFYALGQGVLKFIGTAQGISALKYALLGILLVAIIPLSIAIGSLIAGALPFVLVVAGIVAGGILLGKVIQAVVAHFGGWKGVLKALTPILDQVRALFNRAGAEIRKALADPAIQKAWKQLQAALPQLIPLLKLIAVVVGVVLYVAFQLLMAQLRGFIAMLPSLMQIARGLIEFLGGLARIITDIFTGKWSDIGPAFKQMLHGLLDIAEGEVGAILAYFGGFIEHFLELFGTSGDKVKHAVLRFLAGIGSAVGTFFGGIGAWIGSKLGGAGAAIGGFFNGLGTGLHNGLVKVEGFVTGTVAFVRSLPARIKAEIDRISGVFGNFFGWLYNHNYYWQHLVDFARHQMELLRAGVEHIVARIRGAIAFWWGVIQRDAAFAWGLVQRYVIGPVRALWADLQRIVSGVVSWLRTQWTTLQRDARTVWQMVQNDVGAAWSWIHDHIIKPIQDAIAWIMGVNARVQTAVHDHVVQPIEDAISNLVKNALSWGENLLKNFIQGMKNQIGNLGSAAQSAVKTVGGWLGFHSPAPKVPESALWGPNLIKMFAQGMLGTSGVAGAAAAQVMARVAAQLTGRSGPGVGGAGTGGGTIPGANIINNGSLGALVGALGAGGIGGGPTTITHNWAGAFPNATSKDEIVAAIREVQQQDYRKGRIAGFGQGLDAHIGIR